MKPAHAARWILVAAAALAACSDRIPTTPSAADEEPLIDALWELISGTEPLTMGWLAPLGATSATAPQDAARRPTMTICRWSAGVCIGAPVARFTVETGLTATNAGFAAQWSLTSAAMPLTRTTFRISVTDGNTLVGLPILVEATRGRWALAVPGQTPTLIAASMLPLQFRLGVATAPPPPIATVASGVQSASTQFFPSTTTETRTAQQQASLNALGSSLGALQTALTGPPDAALLALTQARSAANAAFRAAPPGDLANLDVVRLELDQVGRLLGVSG